MALSGDLRRVFEEEIAKRREAELTLLKHYGELNKNLEAKIAQRTMLLEEQGSERLKADGSVEQLQKM